ncbi:putative HTH-type transcriptional regulator YraN [Pullulanibacillus camelliae]|uniref:Putative HTH-type transcriptional regulator YraN n=1 Tax=Pullulanibacillus camelliae TaxID=1707096 RepID=A0A8J2VDM6_9BACL|nr:LysR family transcriptional regulator [Pullulanibacillus camelliae]GGE27724.1 putative HTH-type transcriptional regulator YraN [Pullulanibacillus camelliae]
MDERDWFILSMMDKERSISRLSEELFISQPALTYRINKIESFFGAQLFVRSNSGLHLTPQGDIAIRYAKHLTKDLKRIRENIYSMEEKVKGTIYIGSSTAIAQYYLPDLLSKFIQLYPEVDFNVVTGLSSPLVSSLTRNDIHIAFLREDMEWAPYKHLLTKENIYLVSKEPVDFKDLPHLSRINYRTNPSLKSLIDQWWTNYFQVPPKIAMDVDTAETCIEFVRAGLGYSILTGSCLKSEHDLCCVPLLNKKGIPLKRLAWMYCTKEAVSYLAVRTFLEFVSTTLKEN